MSRKEPEGFLKERKGLPNSNRIIDRSGFELKLIVIGILITVYWQLLPDLTQPISVTGYDLSFTLLNYFYVLSGLAWFATLLFGTFSLAYDQKEIKKTFDRLFKFANWYTMWLLSMNFFMYVLLLILYI